MPSRHASPPQGATEEAAEALTRPGKKKKEMAQRAEALQPSTEAEAVSHTPQKSHRRTKPTPKPAATDDIVAISDGQAAETSPPQPTAEPEPAAANSVPRK